MDGTCVPDEMGKDLECGSGTVESDGECVPESTLACGPGSVEVDGECVPEYDQVLCGDGTVLVEGECVPEPIEIESIELTHFMVGDGETTELRLHNPVEVSMGLSITGDGTLNGESVVVALQNADNGAFCMLGSFLIEQDSDGTEAVYQERFFIDGDCARDAAKNDLALPLDLSPVVLIDSYGTLSLSDPALEEPIELVPGTGDARADGCVRNLEDDSGDCEITFTLNDTAGVEFEVSKVDVRTEAVILPDDCDPDDPEWAEVPEAYRCNGTIVQNADGNYVYGPPDISLDLTVLAWGVDHKRPDAATPEENEHPNLLDEEDLEIYYSIKPVDEDDTAYLPLYLHSEGDPAKAGDETIPSDLPTFVATDQPPKVPQVFSHGLYIENDCGENNLDTCDPDVNPRDEMLTGAWANDTLFDVRACVESAAETATAADGDNCTTTQVMITREGGVDPTADGLGFDYHWSNNQGFGNDWVSLHTVVVAEAKMQANAGDLNQAIGGWVHMGAILELRSNKAGIGTKVIWGDGSGGANENGCILGTCADMVQYGAFLRAFDIQIWSDGASAGNEVSWSTNPSWSRSYGRTFWYNFGPAVVEIYFGAGAEAGIDVSASLDVGTTTNGWLQGQGVGVSVGGTGNAKPYANAYLTASASVNLAVVRAGARGTVYIVDGGTPVNLHAETGLNTANPALMKISLTASASFEITILSGWVEVFLDHRWVSCGWSGCSFTWSSWYTWRLAQWSGWVYSYQFFNLQYHKQYDWNTGALTDI